jgi:hypothetical protein
MGFKPNTWTGQGRLDTIESYLANGPASDTLTRQQIFNTGQGLITQNFDRNILLSNTNSAMIDGTAYFIGVGLRAGDVVSSVSIAVVTGGVGLSISKVGLYSKAGVRLAMSADLTTLWQGTATLTGSFSAPFTILTDDLYYVALFAKTATSMPSTLRGGSGQFATAIGSGASPYGIQTGLTDLPAPAVINFASAGSLCYWVGVS